MLGQLGVGGFGKTSRGTLVSRGVKLYFGHVFFACPQGIRVSGQVLQLREGKLATYLSGGARNGWQSSPEDCVETIEKDFQKMC